MRYNEGHTLMSLESSIYFYSATLPEDSPLRRKGWMEERGCGGFISPSYKDEISRNEAIPFSEWCRFLVKNRNLLLKDCTDATLEVGIMADFQIADFALSVPPELMRALARACVGLSVSLMADSNDHARYGGELYYILSSNAPGDEQKKLPGSIRRHLASQNLHPHVWTKHHALLYTQEELAAAIPAKGEGLVRLSNYIGDYGFASLYVPSALMSDLADRDCTLQLHFNTPQRRGRRCSHALAPSLSI